ncbi:thioredoxin-disulfide reductase [Candidatus Woesearchaeota archaeon]|nr:thioredoxin-disulfide reductase [Candidatus Woesearchaeota archaeon]
MHDLIILGTGVSGLGAAIYAKRFMLNTLVLGELPGGTITKTHLVENYPGFKSVSGMNLAKSIREHAESAGAEIKDEKVSEVEMKENRFMVKTNNKVYDSKAIILATGTEIRKLNVPGEEELANRGVSYCATCDGPLYRDATVAVVGGSDSAAKEALFLTEYAKKVYIIYRKENIRAEPVTAERVKKNKKIEIINNANVIEIKGKEVLSDVVLDRVFNGSKTLKLDGLFVEIGRMPLTELAKKIGVKTDKDGYIVVDSDQRTSVKGIFAAGDVTNATAYKQAITGVAEGVKAAFSAYQFLRE